MPPAARITDMHTCPMVTAVIPHVGGPILPPGVPTVLIGFLPAATVTDMATCVGPPDVIVLGSMGVFVNFLPAARMGDTTAHGGVIVLGEPTCMVGEIGAPSPGSMGLNGVVNGMVATGIAQQQLSIASKLAQGGAAALSGQVPPPAGVMAIRTAEVVNAQMVAAAMDPAWDPGTEVVTESLPVGSRFEMVVDPDRLVDMMRGNTRMGNWAATDAIRNQKEARDKLALSKRYKKDVSVVVTVETTAPMVVHRGTVAPMEGLAGKAGQVQFLGNVAKGPLKIVSSPRILPEG